MPIFQFIYAITEVYLHRKTVISELLLLKFVIIDYNFDNFVLLLHLELINVFFYFTYLPYPLKIPFSLVEFLVKFQTSWWLYHSKYMKWTHSISPRNFKKNSGRHQLTLWFNWYCVLLLQKQMVGLSS